MKRLIPFLILLLPGCRKKFEDVWRTEGGIELEYRLRVPDSERDLSLSAACADILNRRFEILGLRYARAEALGRDRIAVRVAERNRAHVPAIRELLQVQGHVMLDCVNRSDRSTSLAHLGANLTPFRLRPHVWASDFGSVEPEQGPEGWSVRFAFTDMAARRLDDWVNAMLFPQSGEEIELLLDGKRFPKPALFADALQGRGRISGGLDETAARNLSAVLQTSPLPCPLGGYPESERQVAPVTK